MPKLEPTIPAIQLRRQLEMLRRVDYQFYRQLTKGRALDRLGGSDWVLRESSLSLLNGYPKPYLQMHSGGVDRASTTAAEDSVAVVSPGHGSPTETSTRTRNRRTGRPVDDFLMMRTKTNSSYESSPDLYRNHAGVLMQQAITYLVLPESEHDYENEVPTKGGQDLRIP
jgi:hypothetical protein